VQKISGGAWVPAAFDWDHETRFKWKKACFGKSVITIEWKIPDNTPPGEYRICHFGDRKKPGKKDSVSYSGTSSIFEVV
jgi:neutral ceramidase